MEKLSRTEKYKELRESLQNDVGQDLETKDLSRFQDRLNKIDPNAFTAPKQKDVVDKYSPNHARKQMVDPDDISFDNTMDMNYSAGEPSYNTSSNNFSNDYLDKYIDEVKQYNIEQGNAVSEDTTVNILNRIRQAEDSLSKRPYPPRQRPQVNPVRDVEEDTTDVPFLKPSSGKQNNIRVTNNAKASSIASQVQGLINDSSIEDEPLPETTPATAHVSGMNTNEFNKHLELERTTRQQLLNETTQMRSQLDDYEDNLSEVSAKMRHTNQILNIVLVIMIVVLAMVILFILYIMVFKKGA